MLSNIIFWVIFGLIAGSIAFFIDPDKESGGFIQSIFVGILGSVVGGFIANFFGFPQVNGFNLYSFLVAIFGSLLVLFLYKLPFSKR